MSKQPLVSIITPCYNGERFVHRFFDSVLAQTYNNIELIFVNDGSNDKTEEIALSYKDKLESRGIEFTYIYQDNAGQAAAINRGLKIFKGDYLTWPDSDDWMSSDCIEKKVQFLEKNTDCGLVLCQTSMVNEDNIDNVIHYLKRNDIDNNSVFMDLIIENDIYFAPVGYMVRSSMFTDSLPSRHIYECKTGQNWQMMLPIAYKYKCGFLTEPLCFYLVRNDSHSRSEKSYFELLEKTHRHQDTLENVINSISMSNDEKSKYLKIIKLKYARKRFNLAIQYTEFKDIKKWYNELKTLEKVSLDTKLKYHLCKNKYRIKMYKVLYYLNLVLHNPMIAVNKIKRIFSK